MKKKYFNLLAIPALAVIVFCLFSGFSSQDPKHAVQSLIDQRTITMQSFSLGEIPYREAEKRLRQIEDETILKQDLKDLAAEVTSSISRVSSVSFEELTKKKQFFQYIPMRRRLFGILGPLLQRGFITWSLRKRSAIIS